MDAMKEQYSFTTADEIKELLAKRHWEEHERKVILAYFESKQHHFLARLRALYPLINENDLHLILLICINLKSREIARLLNIKVSSLATARYRLMKKMKEGHHSNIKQFILNLYHEEEQKP